jgi:cytochrome oxidase Cu insertion factor (SCO1/SenC/PrrC family)
LRAAAALALLLAVPDAAAHEAGGGGADPTGLPELLYELPAAGSYELPVIDRVSEHELVASDGERAPLLDVPREGCAIVSFVYLSCTDATGCPLALATLQRADRAFARRRDLAGRVRLVTVSFDPERDGPAQMANLRQHMAPKADWRFLTAASRPELHPVLQDYGQDAVPLLTAEGTDTGLMRHVTKVFLVDASGGVRNVYSTGFLDHRILLRDVETLLLAH